MVQYISHYLPWVFAPSKRWLALGYWDIEPNSMEGFQGSLKRLQRGQHMASAFKLGEDFQFQNPDPSQR